uniref:Proteasome activator PA28 C-terminal domain-containing protein n=1 Tax=Ditylenchus dipsaci TaxID=166011 RepID=A0A915EDQ0_9BILA
MTTEQKLLSAMKEEFGSKMRNFISKSLPSNILEFNNLINHSKYSLAQVELLGGRLIEDLAKIEVIDGDELDNIKKLKVHKTNNFKAHRAEFPLEELAVECTHRIEPLLQQAIEDASDIIMWIEFLTPNIEEGNNFGVDIQDSCTAMTRIMLSETVQLLTSYTKFFERRAALVAENKKYPEIEDYVRAINDLDQQQIFQVRYAILMTRNRYARLYEIFSKNMQCITQPRDDNFEQYIV